MRHSGQTSWVRQVRGLQRTGEHKARWEQLAGLAAGVLTQLLERAPRTPRNYILEDQTKCGPRWGQTCALGVDKHLLSRYHACRNVVQTQLRCLGCCAG